MSELTKESENMRHVSTEIPVITYKNITFYGVKVEDLSRAQLLKCISEMGRELHRALMNEKDIK